MQSDSVNRAAAAAGSNSKNQFCLIGSTGVTWHAAHAQLPIAVIRQPGDIYCCSVQSNFLNEN